MPNALVLCYSSYGQVETMARAVAEGACLVEGAKVMVKRVPELVHVVQISAPSRTKVHAYQEMRNQIQQMVGHINGRFAAKGCIPVDYRYEGHSQEELAAEVDEFERMVSESLRDEVSRSD